jgi:aspartokinase
MTRTRNGETMTRIRLGGIKIFEGRAHLSSSSRGGATVLADLCARLAENRINLTLLSHVADNGQGDGVTALCTESADAYSSYFLMKIDGGQEQAVKLIADVNLLSIFPHDQQPQVSGALLATLARAGVRPYGLASSPAAMSFLVGAADTKGAIDSLFDPFVFPAYQSPVDWHAAYQGREQLLKEVICSYQEQVIKVYNIAQQTDLQLWSGVLGWSRLGDLGAALQALGDLGIKLPFLVAQTGPDERLLLAFCLARAEGQQAGTVLAKHLSADELTCCPLVSAVFLHGPHFGDRYGIANALVAALDHAAITPLAISCAVSSMSVVVQTSDLDSTLQALETRFVIPGS